MQDENINPTSFKSPKVLCIGDLMLDTFVYGSVERLSPEAPVPILKTNKEIKMLGGAGNVATNLASLGCQVTLLSSIGNDPNGTLVLSFLEKFHNIESYIFTDKTKKTTAKTRFVCGNQHLLRVDEESTNQLSEQDEASLTTLLNEFKTSFDIVVVADYNKGLLTDNMKEILTKEFEAIVIIDTKNSDIEKYKSADLLVPNIKELESYSRTKIHSKDEILNEAKRLMKKYNIPKFLVTKGSDGMVLIGTDTFEVKALNNNPKDVSGAGDTVVAALALALGSGFDYKTSVWISNIAASIVVDKPGTSTIDLEELVKKIQQIQEVTNQ